MVVHAAMCEVVWRLFTAESSRPVAKRCRMIGGVRYRLLRRGCRERCRAGQFCTNGRRMRLQSGSCDACSLVKFVAAPGTHLNSRLRGGGKTGNGGPNLLDELAKVVSKLKSAAISPEKGQVEHVVLDALTTVLERAKNNPVGLLARVETLIKKARAGALNPPTPPKEVRSPGPEPNSRGKGPVGEKATGKGGAVTEDTSDKGNGKAKDEQRPKVELEPTCWGDHLGKWLDVVACLEKCGPQRASELVSIAC